MTGPRPYIGPAQARVLLLIALEPQRTCEIISKSELVASRSALADTLKSLAKKKLVRKAGRGLWALETDHAVDDALDEAWNMLQGQAS